MKHLLQPLHHLRHCYSLCSLCATATAFADAAAGWGPHLHPTASTVPVPATAVMTARPTEGREGRLLGSGRGPVLLPPLLPATAFMTARPTEGREGRLLGQAVDLRYCRCYCQHPDIQTFKKLRTPAKKHVHYICSDICCRCSGQGCSTVVGAVVGSRGGAALPAQHCLARLSLGPHR